MEPSFMHGGVSRSGRVRKKPAKLMEMDLSMDERPMERSSGSSSYVENKTAALSSALMGSSHTTAARHGGLNSPPQATSSRRQSSSSSSSLTAAPVNFMPIVQRVQPPMPALDNRRSSEHQQQPPRVIAIKAMEPSPHFDNLSGSTYLIGDDVHFITGEPVDSDPEQHQNQQRQQQGRQQRGQRRQLQHDPADDEDDDDEDDDDDDDDKDDDDDDDDNDCIGHHRGYRLSPLKVDIGGHVIDESNLTVAAASSASLGHGHSSSGDDGDGLRMKFILSPKTSSSSSFDKGKGSQSKSKKSKKSSKSHSNKKSSSSSGFGNVDGVKSKKKKKKGKSADDHPPSATSTSATSSTFLGMPVLEVLPKAARRASDRFNSSDSDSDDADGDSKLVIAEPPVLQPMAPIGKSKKKSGKSSSKSKKKSGSGGLVFKHDHKDPVANAASASESLGQQHSVYLKEKNASKKRIGKKIVKTRDKGEPEVAKARPMSAYMLFAREHRSHVVRTNPGIDFAAISKRLGEVWQSLSEFEKTSWRRKAKMSSFMPTTTSNVINTGKKQSDVATKHIPDVGRSSGSGSGSGNTSAGTGGSGSSGKVYQKATPPTVTTSSAPTTPDDASSCESPGASKPVGTTPLDVAAHLKLLGESLSIIGQRLTEHEGQIAVSGSLSVLLDSTLCALGPLTCLTSEVDNLDGAPKSTQERILDNIAYIMPGL